MRPEPYDEKRIGDDDIIIRRIDPVHHVLWDENRNCNRISSMAYKTTTGLSVDVESLMIAEGIEPKVYVTSPRFTGSVAFTAGSIRSLDLMVGYSPIKDQPGLPDNPYHGEVWSKAGTKRLSDRQVNGLGSTAVWYVSLEGVSIWK